MRGELRRRPLQDVEYLTQKESRERPIRLHQLNNRIPSQMSEISRKRNAPPAVASAVKRAKKVIKPTKTNDAPSEKLHAYDGPTTLENLEENVKRPEGRAID